MDVGVHGEGVLFEPLSQNHLSGFGADPWEFDEFLESIGDLAELLNALGTSPNGFCFAVEIATREDDFFQLFLAQL